MVESIVATNIGIESSVSTTTRGTMTCTALNTTSPLDVALRQGAETRGESSCSLVI
jgi:hypothetical protein